MWGAAAAEEQVTGYLLSYQRFMNLTTFVNGDLSLSYSILGLQRYTDYLVSIAAINKAGNSLFTTLEAFRTEADLPSPPQVCQGCLCSGYHRGFLVAYSLHVLPEPAHNV